TAAPAEAGLRPRPMPGFARFHERRPELLAGPPLPRWPPLNTTVHPPRSRPDFARRDEAGRRRLGGRPPGGGAVGTERLPPTPAIVACPLASGGRTPAPATGASVRSAPARTRVRAGGCRPACGCSTGSWHSVPPAQGADTPDRALLRPG